jgi:hypothetical protein
MVMGCNERGDILAWSMGSDVPESTTCLIAKAERLTQSYRNIVTGIANLQMYSSVKEG